tara:strand:- start:239 stop:1411 length:1173 start_codon:yes stop_codon:yes gene_type:complete
MKKPHVLNRSMFNRGGTSAYGRGITSNLVTEEQRQKFNYGGRVGYADRGLVAPLYPRGVIPNPVLGGSFEEREKYRLRGDPINLEEKFKEWYEVPDTYTSDPGALQFGGKEWEDAYATPKQVRRRDFIEEKPEHFEKEFEAWKEEGPGKKWVKRKDKYDEITAAVEGEQPTDETNTTLEMLLADKSSDGVSAPLTDTKELKVDEESDVLGLTPEERTAMKAHMAFGMGAAGAASKGKTWQDVIKDTLAGGSAVAAKAVDPKTGINLRRKYEEYGKASRKSAQETWDREKKYAQSEEGQIDKVMEILKIPDREKAREVVYFPKNTGIKKLNAKKKKDEYKMYTDNEEAFIEANGGAIFDETAQVFVLYIDGKRHTTSKKSDVMKAKSKGLI